MKKVVRQVPAHTARSFQCEVCGHRYHTQNQALRCEVRIKEKKVFNKGDLVKGIERHVCDHWSGDKYFQPIGKITKILGPMRPDYEYETKWLGGKPERINGHIYLYEVTYLCWCGKTRSYLYRTPEIVFLKNKNR